MTNRLHLHDAEVLLCHVRPAGSSLVAGCLFGVIDALIATGGVFVAMGTGVWAWSGSFPSAVWLLPVFVVCVVLACFLKYRQWKSASLRITTERIMLDYPSGIAGSVSRTIKWPQYQESFVGSASPLAVFWRARPLCLRYGSSDGEAVLRFPAIRHARDLKHYLDKADTFIRKHEGHLMPPFVAKPRGQRDQASSSADDAGLSAP